VELRASDGAELAVFYIKNATTGVAFDGANIWVADSLSNAVNKF
jgi:hypothetical protein